MAIELRNTPLSTFFKTNPGVQLHALDDKRPRSSSRHARGGLLWHDRTGRGELSVWQTRGMWCGFFKLHKKFRLDIVNARI